ncbi:ROK family protein [Listeria fleischmannii]|uniref:ROK family protein n=1 Tax=Listeria fleischmannii TaxID=1069827 RepID=UPI001627CE90|nr:ROK family protein [Listeria fleischmannii]MBC1417489.1 ROK family protein [Listeria fleischmannii]
MKLYGAIEAGGTKFVCAVGNRDLEIIEQVSFQTRNPDETMEEVVRFFSRFTEELQSIGVGSFGPIDIQQDSENYGYITSTPKLSWQYFDFVGTLKKYFNLPIAWTTDVNAACYGEYVKGNGIGLSNVVYYTIGTGVGGAALQNGYFIEGFSHPEMGHMIVNKHPNDSFEGTCPFHKHCLEGMAAGPTIEKRYGRKGQELAEDDTFWEIEAYYIAQCVYNTTLLFSPDIIILGGGVISQQHILPKVHSAFVELMNGYVKTPDLVNYVVTPKLGSNAGTIGCLALAEKLTNQ